MRWATILWLLLMAGCLRSTPRPDPPQLRAPVPGPLLTVRIFAAGQADAILLTTRDGHRVLVDAGRALGGDHLIKRRLIPHFKKHHIQALDAFIITHPHPDHLGDPVLLRRQVSFARIHTNLDGAHFLRNLVPRLRKAGVTTAQLHRGDWLQYGGLRLDVLNPPRTARPAAQVSRGSDQNQRSLVLRATFGRVRFLLAGDVTLPAEHRMLAAGLPGRAEVLKLGHHGHNSTSDAWLRRIRPRYAVATCGDYYGRMRPLPELLLARLKQHKVTLLRTDRDGDVVFQTNGEALSVKTHPSWKHRPKLLLPP